MVLCGFMLLCQSEVMLTPFLHWNTLYLIIPPFNNRLTYLQILIYSFFWYSPFFRKSEKSLFETTENLFLKILSVQPVYLADSCAGSHFIILVRNSVNST